jgi:hypothetical protein
LDPVIENIIKKIENGAAMKLASICFDPVCYLMIFQGMKSKAYIERERANKNCRKDFYFENVLKHVQINLFDILHTRWI